MTQPLPRTYQELRWLDDLDPMAAETSSDLESLEQDVMHVVKERLASNLDDPARGIGIEDFLGSNAGQFLAVAATIDAQLVNDSRVTTSLTTITQNSDGTYTVTVQVQVGAAVVNLNYSLGPNGLAVLRSG